MIGYGNFKQLNKLIFLEVKLIGFIKPVIGEGFVDQDVDSLIKRHIGEESCNIIRDQAPVVQRVDKFIQWIQVVFSHRGVYFGDQADTCYFPCSREV